MAIQLHVSKACKLIVVLTLTLSNFAMAGTNDFSDVQCLQKVNKVIRCKHEAGSGDLSVDDMTCSLRYSVRTVDGTIQSRVLTSRNTAWRALNYVNGAVLTTFGLWVFAGDVNRIANETNNRQMQGIEENVNLLKQLNRCEDFEGDLEPAPDRKAE